MQTRLNDSLKNYVLDAAIRVVSFSIAKLIECFE